MISDHLKFKFYGGPTQGRTGDTRIFSPLLYLLSYRANFLKKLADQTRIELAISTVTEWHVNRYTTGPLFDFCTPQTRSNNITQKKKFAQEENVKIFKKS